MWLRRRVGRSQYTQAGLGVGAPQKRAVASIANSELIGGYAMKGMNIYNHDRYQHHHHHHHRHHHHHHGILYDVSLSSLYCQYYYDCFRHSPVIYHVSYIPGSWKWPRHEPRTVKAVETFGVISAVFKTFYYPLCIGDYENPTTGNPEKNQHSMEWYFGIWNAIYGGFLK